MKKFSAAEGRALSPKYWAGLVLLGNIEPIALQEKGYWQFWIIGGLVVMAAMAGFYILRKRS